MGLRMAELTVIHKMVKRLKSMPPILAERRRPVPKISVNVRRKDNINAKQTVRFSFRQSSSILLTIINDSKNTTKAITLLLKYILSYNP